MVINVVGLIEGVDQIIVLVDEGATPPWVYTKLSCVEASPQVPV